MKLRDYQIDIVDQFAAALMLHRCIVIACPTASGKTVLAIDGILPLLPHPVAWVTHRVELAQQIKSHDSGVTVIMSQSRTGGGGFKSIIIDEAHHACADQYRRIMAQNPDSVIVALTATPYRMDGAGLGECGFTKIIYGPDILELTERGWLCPAIVLVPVSEESASWTPSATASRIAGEKFNQGIVYCRTVEEAVKTSKLLQYSRISSATISSDTHLSARTKTMSDFANGRLRVVCNHTIITEGNDIPAVDLIVLNRATESRCLWRQMTGRGLRQSPGKKLCIILDLSGNGIQHGSIYDREIFDLSGSVKSTEQRALPTSFNREESQYEHNHGEELKVWKPKPKPIRIIENLQKLKSKSPLHRLRTDLNAYSLRSANLIA